MDEMIEAGTAWPAELARNHARSKLLLAILSRDYFQSKWCRLEMALMHAREKAAGLGTHANPSRLIVPLIIDDGDQFPAEIQAIQGEKIHGFANPFMRPDSPRQEELAEIIRTRVCPSIEHMLNNVPAYNPEWEAHSHEQFENAFQIQIKEQLTVPLLTLPSLP